MFKKSSLTKKQQIALEHYIEVYGEELAKRLFYVAVYGEKKAREMIEEERVCLDALGTIGRLLIMSFEHIITEPREAAEKILNYFQVDGDITRMITEVHKRDTLSLPDMTLEDNLIETKAASTL